MSEGHARNLPVLVVDHPFSLDSSLCSELCIDQYVVNPSRVCNANIDQDVVHSVHGIGAPFVSGVFRGEIANEGSLSVVYPYGIHSSATNSRSLSVTPFNRMKLGSSVNVAGVFRVPANPKCQKYGKSRLMNFFAFNVCRNKKRDYPSVQLHRSIVEFPLWLVRLFLMSLLFCELTYCAVWWVGGTAVLARAPNDPPSFGVLKQ